MAHFRLIVRGHWNPERDDYSGFFTNRSLKADDLTHAAEKALETLSSEWAHAPFVACGGTGLKLDVLDGWRVSRLSAWWRSGGGHSFFSTEGEEADAASIEAQAANAPKDAQIWCIASPPGSAKSDFYVFD